MVNLINLLHQKLLTWGIIHLPKNTKVFIFEDKVQLTIENKDLF